MHLNYLAFAVPLFLTCMILEWLVANRRKDAYFHLQDSVANVSIGMAERLIDVFVTGLFFFIYDYLQRHVGLFTIRPGILLWLLLLLCTDFMWYWYHRLAHEINLFWALHVVHHQSEDFNYTVSARVTVFQAFVRTGFWCILPIIGFPASMITSMLLVHGLYPFFIHTRTIGRLGILEYILVTPSHHRVHHASNERYLDKNYGDVFIIWDKLFGTFSREDEDEEIRYGLTTPLKSYSFLWQHFHYVAELLVAARKVKGWQRKFNVFFGRPCDIPESTRQEAAKVFGIFVGERSSNLPLNKYVIWQMVITLITLFVFILVEPMLGVYSTSLVASLILLTLVNCGAIMEQKQWVFYLEFSRLLLAGLLIVLIWPNAWLSISLLTLATLLAYYSPQIKTYYFKWVYAI